MVMQWSKILYMMIIITTVSTTAKFLELSVCGYVGGDDEMMLMMIH